MSKQASEQKGIGTSVPTAAPGQESAPSPQTGPNGSSQGESRGKDGKSTG